jgi:hypothetical protein
VSLVALPAVFGPLEESIAVALLVVFGPLKESIVVALALFVQSNYVSGYPNEKFRYCGCHCCFRVVGSNSYYSLIFLIDIFIVFCPKKFCFHSST